ncbi:hypothetical protein Slin15195_G078180 [Septoria linicola]|uniref:Uncharacterized protein n=1 Tax=Septoria linicola TaxID=215465 RepID=A0A9Q9AS98_9PEZI|nr:hypothetical protein Slin14017_G039370 [Septoria linicola]USW54499.1 hypothetical protein Slin15195_G078180 [Septoria linicola]
MVGPAPEIYPEVAKAKRNAQTQPCPRIIDDDSVKSPTAVHLEKIAQAFITAINARNFDTSTYPYKDHISSAFQGDLERPPGVVDLGLKGLDEQMAMYRYVTDTYPDYWIRIFDLNTYVDEKAGKAMMYFNGETMGLGDGVKMPSLGTLEFQSADRW